jgi:hypothetical protein
MKNKDWATINTTHHELFSINYFGTNTRLAAPFSVKK